MQTRVQLPVIRGELVTAVTAHSPTAEGLKGGHNGPVWSHWCRRDSSEPMYATETQERVMQWTQSHERRPASHGNDCPGLKMLLLCPHTLQTGSGAQYTSAYSNNFTIFCVHASAQWLPF